MSIAGVIRKLEELPINSKDKKNLILSAFPGESGKPTSITHLEDISHWQEERRTQEQFYPIPPGLVRQYSLLLNMMQMQYLRTFLPVKTDGNKGRYEVMRISVGRDRKKILALEDALKAEDHIKAGMLLGYPENALMQLGERTTRRFHEYITDNYTPDTVPHHLLFIQHVPEYHKDGAPDQKSESLAKKHMDLLKRVSPKIYSDYVKAEKQVIFPIDQVENLSHVQ